MLFAVPQEIITDPPLPTESDVIFLSSFDGLNTQQTAVDRSSLNAYMLFRGGAQLSTAQAKFGQSSLHITPADGTGVRTPFNAAYQSLIAEDFTIEGFVYLEADPSNGQLISMYGNGPNGASAQWDLQFSGLGFVRFLSTPSDGVPNYTQGYTGMSLHTWYHIAVCCFRHVLRIFVNGVMIATDIFAPTGFRSNSIIGLAIGSDWDFASQYNNVPGYIDEVMVTAGARYRSDAGFTPPTGPFYRYLPSLFVDQDIFYVPRISPYGTAPALFVDQDVFYSPSVSPRTIRPALVDDSINDHFYAPLVGVTAIWNGATGGATISGTHSNIVTGAGGTAGQFADQDGTGLKRSQGKIYWEITPTFTAGSVQYLGFGIVTNINGGVSAIITTASGGVILYQSGHVWINGVDHGAVLPPLVSGETYGIALSFDHQEIWFKRVSGTTTDWNGVVNGDPVIVLGGIAIPNISNAPWLVCCTLGGTGGTATDAITAAFGGYSSFVGSVPTGFAAGWAGGL